MKITVFGTGYVGLVTGACLAAVGYHVMCVDTDAEKIECLKAGIVSMYEPGLESMVQENLAAGRLMFTTSAKEAATFGHFLFIAVGTPSDEDGSADLQHVLTVAAEIAQHIDGYRIVVNKSTVPVGTADKVARKISSALSQRSADFAVDVVSNPEFLKEGTAISDFMKPDRIVLGTNNQSIVEQFRQLYAPFNRNHDRLIFMDVRSAELTKYAANAMLATKISFMNEMANLAERLGADIEKVRLGIGADPRIGYQFIYAGCGYGGSCFPKDVRALARTATTVGYVPRLLNAVDSINYDQKRKIFKNILRHFGDETHVRGKTFALWGLSFKPNTDDMREAPSRVLMEALWAVGAKVQAYDPKAMEEARRLYGHREDLLLTEKKEDALKGAEALIISTEWKGFTAPDFDWMSSCLKQRLIFDGRNLYDPAKLSSTGWTYYGIGRGASCIS